MRDYQPPSDTQSFGALLQVADSGIHPTKLQWAINGFGISKRMIVAGWTGVSIVSVVARTSVVGDIRWPLPLIVAILVGYLSRNTSYPERLFFDLLAALQETCGEAAERGITTRGNSKTAACDILYSRLPLASALGLWIASSILRGMWIVSIYSTTMTSVSVRRDIGVDTGFRSSYTL